MKTAAIASLLFALGSPSCLVETGQPHTASLSEIEERERIGDRKMRENDPSYVDEYQVAIGLAEAAAAKATEPLRDAFLLLASGVSWGELGGGSGLIEWRHRAKEVIVRMTPDERSFLQNLADEMTQTQRESTLHWLSNAEPRDALLGELEPALRDWRQLSELLARMRRKCSG